MPGQADAWEECSSCSTNIGIGRQQAMLGFLNIRTL